VVFNRMDAAQAGRKDKNMMDKNMGRTKSGHFLLSQPSQPVLLLKQPMWHPQGFDKVSD